MAPKTAQIIKPGKVVILLNGRYAGAKVTPISITPLSPALYSHARALFFDAASTTLYPRAMLRHAVPML